MSQFDSRNLTMMMDLYELTMSQGYFRLPHKPRVAFEVFFRRVPDNAGFALFAGLEQIIDLVTKLHFTQADIDYLRSLNLFDDDFLDFLRSFSFAGDIYALPEGTVMYPSEPVVTVCAGNTRGRLLRTPAQFSPTRRVNHEKTY